MLFAIMGKEVPAQTLPDAHTPVLLTRLKESKLKKQHYTELNTHKQIYIYIYLFFFSLEHNSTEHILNSNLHRYK